MNANPEPSIDAVLSVIRRIIAELSIEPEKTKVTAEKIGMRLVAIEIDPNPSDYSKILGKNGGDHLAAMRMICKLVSDRGSLKYQLRLIEIPKGIPQSVMPPFKPAMHWRKDEFQVLTEDIFALVQRGSATVVISDQSGKENTAIEVIVGKEVPKGTVDWINQKLHQLYKSMGLKNGRIMSFNLIQP